MKGLDGTPPSVHGRRGPFRGIRAGARGLLLPAVLALAAAGCASSAQRRAAAPVPAEFGPLYSELSGELSAAEKEAAALPGGGPCALSAPALFPASSYFTRYAAPGTPAWNAVLAMLDRLRSLGAGGVSVMISFPDLTPEASDPGPVLEFYSRLAAEVRKRHMLLLVEEFVYPPSAPTASGRFVAGLKDLPEPEKSFLDLKKRETELILARIRPDYLSVVTEPETNDSFLGFSISPDDYAGWLRGLVADALAAGIKGRTRIGAGSGVWEGPEYIDAFAAVKGLDYIDFHFYPLRLGDADYTAALLDAMGRVRKADPSKGLVMSETWLYKHGADEPGGVFDAAAYARNAYGFWEPLDARFLSLLELIGRKEGVELITPYFPQYFFYAADYDPARKPDWPACLPGEWKVAESSSARELTPLGRAYKELRAGCSAAGR